MQKNASKCLFYLNKIENEFQTLTTSSFTLLSLNKSTPLLSKQVQTFSKHDAIKSNYCIHFSKQVQTCSKHDANAM
jgi:hypothetical protein